MYQNINCHSRFCINTELLHFLKFQLRSCSSVSSSIFLSCRSRLYSYVLFPVSVVFITISVMSVSSWISLGCPCFKQTYVPVFHYITFITNLVPQRCEEPVVRLSLVGSLVQNLIILNFSHSWISFEAQASLTPLLERFISSQPSTHGGLLIHGHKKI